MPEEMTYPDTTVVWEKSLEEVASGSRRFEEFYAAQLKSLSALLEKAKVAGMTPATDAVSCPSCGKLMIRRHGKNGCFSVFGEADEIYWRCRDCALILSEHNGELVAVRCPKCDGKQNDIGEELKSKNWSDASTTFARKF